MRVYKEASEYFKKLRDDLKDPEVKVFALETWYKYMFPYIPYRTGVLASTAHLKYQSGPMINPSIDPSVNVTEDGIYFGVPYARRLYFGDGFDFSKEMHPLAQAHWGQAALDIHGSAIAKEVEAFIIRRGD